MKLFRIDIRSKVVPWVMARDFYLRRFREWANKYQIPYDDYTQPIVENYWMVGFKTTTAEAKFVLTWEFINRTECIENCDTL